MSTTGNQRVVEVLPLKDQILSMKRNTPCSVEGCNKTFLHEGMLKMHLVKSHGLINTESEKRLFSKIQKKASDVKYIFFCPEEDCKYRSGEKHFTTFHLLRQHYMKMHAEKKFFCQKCNNGFSEQRFLRQHEEQCGNLYTCGTCPVYYTTREALQTHCKRQEHVYPEEYKKKDKEKEEKKKVKKKSTTSDADNGSTKLPISIPVLLLAVEKTEPTPSLFTKGQSVLLPKPRLINGQCTSSSQFTNVQTSTDTQKNPLPAVAQLPGVAHESSIHENSVSMGTTNRQEVMIQTDIYGVRHLSVSGNNQEHGTVNYNRQNYDKDYNIVNNPKVIETNRALSLVKSPSSPKGKQRALKRKGTYPRPASPRRKKTKTTTGIQTSVSLTQRKRAQIVGSTQTTGDLILRKAMAEADIPIQTRNVGSQVTPNKRNSASRNLNTNNTADVSVGTTSMLMRRPLFKDSFSQVDQFNKPMLVDSYSQACGEDQPLLVDSFSQVRQGNIIAETSDLLAEQQTMTDMPESISTQTFQSFLIDRQNTNSHSIGHGYSLNNTVGSDKTLRNPQITNQKIKGSTVEIFNDRLETSVKFQVPVDNTPKSSRTFIDMDPRKAYLQKIRNQKRATSTVTTDTGEMANSANSMEVNSTATNFNRTVQINDIAVDTSTSTSTTTDNEAQAMSAEEFIQLLQSSGVHLEVSSDPTTEGFDTQPGTSKQSSTETDLINYNFTGDTNYNIYDMDRQTIDTNTQTVSDFDLFDGIGAIDMNTQTTGNSIDFLDLVMNNMETQTLNDEDIDSLGLASLSSSHSTGHHSLSIGTSSFGMSSKATSPRARFDDSAEYPISLGFDTNSLGIGTSDFEIETDGFDSNSILMPGPTFVTGFTQTLSTCTGTSTQTGSHSYEYVNEKVKVQSETQTTGSEAGIQLIQTETQTQIDPADFNVTNMETQTTFDEFCDWLM